MRYVLRKKKRIAETIGENAAKIDEAVEKLNKFACKFMLDVAGNHPIFEYDNCRFAITNIQFDVITVSFISFVK